MTSAFCPGHVSCVFQPVDSLDAMGTGSRGIGIRLDRGATATVSPRDDDVVNISLDGVMETAHITRMVAQILAPGRGFDIRIENDLPVSQGFGMSAAGAIATGLCIADMTGQSRNAAFSAAHAAEVSGGGGLGDVAAIVAGGDVPVRTVAGLPPFGRVESAGFRMEGLTLGVIGGELRTDTVLGDPERLRVVREAAVSAMDSFLAGPCYDRLFEVSNAFSSQSGLESPAIRKGIERLKSRGFHAGMCMLGNSIFTDAPEKDVWAVFGRGHVRTFRCSSSRKEIVIRRG